MVRFLGLALAACAACSPASENTPTAAFATQIAVPAPDYAKLVPEPPVMPKGELNRRATARAPADAKAIGGLWIERIEAKGVHGGHGLAGKTPDGPVSSIHVLMTAKEFDAWLAAEGWSAPRHIGWNFVPETVAPRITEAARAKVRMWPASQVRTGAQNAALLGGRITLEDGCFFVDLPAEGRKLAWFFAETGLAVDPQGYLVFVNRVTGETMARVGEDMVWGGPNGLPDEPAALEKLRAACGADEVYPVGNPEAREHMVTNYPHLHEPRVPPTPPPAD